jgi:2-iminobutanoate/2-iminopropanoate deaminase
MTGDPYGPGEIMTTIARDVGVSKHIGSYSDAIEAPAGMRWLFTSGTPGISPETGDLPKGIEAQTRQAWANIFTALKKANMSPADMVKVNTTLIDANDRATYFKVRKELLGDVKPAFMLAVVNELVRADILVEIEVVAAAK